MGLNLTTQEVDAVRLEAEQQCPPATSIDRLETIRTVPAELGYGYHRDMELCPELRPLLRGNDRQQVFSPKITGAMRAAVQQIIDCPFWGITKRLYLQGKVFELMALQLDGMINPETANSAGALKADTIARIHYWTVTSFIWSQA